MTDFEAYQEYIQRKHNAFCKAVIRYAARDKILQLRRKWERQISLDYLMDEKFVQFAGPEPDEEYPFTVCGQTVLLCNETLASALYALPQQLQGKLDMPPRCAARPADMYADHPLRLAQEVVTEKFFLCLLRQTGEGGGKFRMVQNGSLAAGSKKIFFKLLRLGKLDKLLIHQIVKGNFPFPPPAQLQNYIYGGVTNDNLAKGVKGVLDMHLVGFIFGHGNSPFLIIVRGGSTPCCRSLTA